MYICVCRTLMPRTGNIVVVLLTRWPRRFGVKAAIYRAHTLTNDRARLTLQLSFDESKTHHQCRALKFVAKLSKAKNVRDRQTVPKQLICIAHTPTDALLRTTFAFTCSTHTNTHIKRQQQVGPTVRSARSGLISPRAALTMPFHTSALLVRNYAPYLMWSSSSIAKATTATIVN